MGERGFVEHQVDRPTWLVVSRMKESDAQKNKGVEVVVVVGVRPQDKDNGAGHAQGKIM